MELLFWFAAAGTLYSYFIYPLILVALKKSKHSFLDVPHTTSPSQSITIIISAHNEETQIEDKLINTLELEKKDLDVQIIVASDCSTDRTDEIVKQHADQGIELIRADQHLGKEYAQLCGINAADGDIIVFSDAATRLPKDSLTTLIRYFSDKNVGAISSEDRFLSENGEVAGEGYYVKYEMWLRKLESQCAGLVGLSGSFFAARKEICAEWDIKSPSDFNTALNAAKNGKLAISCPDVNGFYPNIKDESKEYQRKLRTAIRGMTGLSRHKEILNPTKFGLFAFQVWSHKVMRWLVPWFMILALFSNLQLLDSGFYIFTLIVQLSGLSIYFCASRLPAIRKNSLLKIIYFFYQVNIALAHAAIKFLSGTRMTTWQPSARK